jgi:hypothetical protein
MAPEPVAQAAITPCWDPWPQLDGDVPGGGVGQDVRDKKRAYPAVALLLQNLLLLQEEAVSSGARAEDDTDPLAAVLFDRQAGVADGLKSGCHSHLGAAVHAPQLLGSYVLSRLEVLDLSRDLHFEG